MSEAVPATKPTGNAPQGAGQKATNPARQQSPKTNTNGANGHAAENGKGVKGGQNKPRNNQANGAPRRNNNGGQANKGANNGNNKPRNANNGQQKAAGGNGQARQPNLKGLSVEQFAMIAEVRAALQNSGFSPLEDDIILALKQNNFDAAAAAQKMKDARQNSWSALVSKNIKTKPQVEAPKPAPAPKQQQQQQQKPKQPAAAAPAPKETAEAAEQRALRVKAVTDKLAELTREAEAMRSGSSESSQLQAEQTSLEVKKAELKAESDKVQARLAQISTRLVELRKHEEQVLAAIKETSQSIANL